MYRQARGTVAGPLGGMPNLFGRNLRRFWQLRPFGRTGRVRMTETPPRAEGVSRRRFLFVALAAAAGGAAAAAAPRPTPPPPPPPDPPPPGGGGGAGARAPPARRVRQPPSPADRSEPEPPRLLSQPWLGGGISRALLGRPNPSLPLRP